MDRKQASQVCLNKATASKKIRIEKADADGEITSVKIVCPRERAKEKCSKQREERKSLVSFPVLYNFLPSRILSTSLSFSLSTPIPLYLSNTPVSLVLYFSVLYLFNLHGLTLLHFCRGQCIRPGILYLAYNLQINSSELL